MSEFKKIKEFKERDTGPKIPWEEYQTAETAVEIVSMEDPESRRAVIFEMLNATGRVRGGIFPSLRRAIRVLLEAGALEKPHWMTLTTPTVSMFSSKKLLAAVGKYRQDPF
jgi:hypothetical protein